jgi:hypothetical protein
MRPALAAALIFVLFAPAAASAQARNPAVCQRIAQQLVHYDAMKVRANDAGQTMWVDRFEDHIEMLEGHFADKCPEQAAQQQAIQQMAALLKSAGNAALSFFTMGAY